MKRLGVAVGFLCAGYVSACGARSDILDRQSPADAASDDSVGAGDGGDDAAGRSRVAGHSWPRPTAPEASSACGGSFPRARRDDSPASGATDVPANESLAVVRFSADVTAASLAGAVTLSGGGRETSAGPCVRVSGMTATFTPSAALPLGLHRVRDRRRVGHRHRRDEARGGLPVAVHDRRRRLGRRAVGERHDVPGRRRDRHGVGTGSASRPTARSLHRVGGLRHHRPAPLSARQPLHAGFGVDAAPCSSQRSSSGAPTASGTTGRR